MIMRALTQEQRLAWTMELLSDEPDAQPLTKIAASPTTAVLSVDDDMRILLGQEPIPLP